MRYTGPSAKKARRLAQGFTNKETRILGKRATPPGQHGGERSKLSEYALQLREKQRMKFAYGLTERQFYRMFLLAQKQAGPTGENLLRTLESRLDNVIFRMQLASTRSQARQLVSHGYIYVNGKKLDVPSALLKAGDTVAVNPAKSKKSIIAKLKTDSGAASLPDWLDFSAKDLKGKVISSPVASQHAEPLNSQLVVEHYQKI